MKIQNAKLSKFKKIFLLGPFLILAFVLFFAFQAKSQLPQEILEQLEKKEVFACTEIPLGRHLIETKMFQDKFLPLLIELTKESRDIYLSSKKLANLSKECNSKNCAALCASAYGECFFWCSKGCIITGPGYGACVDVCRATCEALPKKCLVVQEKNCYEFLTIARIFETVRQGHPCMPRTRDASFYTKNIPEEEYQKAKKSGEEFQKGAEKLRELEKSLDELKNESLRLADAFALWYQEKDISDLFDCYTAKDMDFQGSPKECAFEGFDYYHCK